MIFSKHCSLCENEITSLENGVTCKLTNRKPEFKNTCSEIKLNNKFLEKLEIANLEFERIRRNKNAVHLNFYFLLTVGFLLIFTSSALAELTLNTTYFWYYKVGIIGTGISIIIAAYFKLITFREKLGNAKHEKNKIDEVLDKYRISYELKLDFKEKIRGTQEVNVELELKNWTKKRTITTYKINY